MTQEEKARAFDEVMADVLSLNDKPHRLFLTLGFYAKSAYAKQLLEKAYRNAHKLLERP